MRNRGRGRPARAPWAGGIREKRTAGAPPAPRRHVPGVLSSTRTAGVGWRIEQDLDDAITLLAEVLADQLRALGPNRSDAVASRDCLARAYRQAVRVDDAAAVLDWQSGSEGMEADRAET